MKKIVFKTKLNWRCNNNSGTDIIFQREAVQRDALERERRQRLEAEARMRDAMAEAERARSMVHHLQRELAR